MEQGIKEKLERFKVKAEIFLSKNIKAFIVDANNDFYFCDIESVGEDYLIVMGFAGQRKSEKDKIFFIDILRFEEYEEKEE
ncbi:hypothetical protein LCGC14_1714220 [marine sediment metagenome]|uniref:Uncharacterized protein n=1 Tax=marine sediment metagenome TaxID=412755 RepID=A0A0F9KED0_9ZZZZ